MTFYYVVTIGYLLCFFYLIQKRRLSLVFMVLIYTGPVLSVCLHLYFPDYYLMGGANIKLQTIENTGRLLLVSFLGLLGVAVSYVKPSRLIYSMPGAKLSLSYFEIVLWSLVGLSVLIYIMPSYKVYHEGYHYSLAAVNEIPGLNVGRNIAHSIFAVVFVSMVINKNKYRKQYAFFVGFILVYVEILSGVRSEAIGLLVALLAYTVDYGRLNMGVYGKCFGLNKLSCLLLFVVVVLLIVIEQTRTGGELLFGNFPTFNAVASSFLSAVYLIDSGYTDFFYGKTYVDLIMQTLPQSIYPDRPMVPAQFILTTPYAAAGGAYIVGTAYMNFWLLGPFFIMYFVGRIMQVIENGLLSRHVLKQVLYLSFVMGFFRLMYYSELSSYKMLIVGVISFLLIRMVNLLLKGAVGRF